MTYRHNIAPFAVHSPNELESELDTLSQDGWDVVSVLEFTYDNYCNKYTALILLRKPNENV